MNMLTQWSQKESACGQVRSPCQQARRCLACTVCMFAWPSYLVCRINWMSVFMQTPFRCFLLKMHTSWLGPASCTRTAHNATPWQGAGGFPSRFARTEKAQLSDLRRWMLLIICIILRCRLLTLCTPGKPCLQVCEADWELMHGERKHLHKHSHLGLSQCFS